MLGIERNPDAARVAATAVDRLIVGDVEHAITWATVPQGMEVALFIDVLEHLIDPWRALVRLREHLAPGARVLASVPNVACWSVRRELLFGRFVPASTGLHDPSHLHFFTIPEAKRLLAESGYVVTSCEPLWTSVPLAHRMRLVPGLTRKWNRWWVTRYPNLAIAVPLIEARQP